MSVKHEYFLFRMFFFDHQRKSNIFFSFYHFLDLPSYFLQEYIMNVLLRLIKIKMFKLFPFFKIVIILLLLFSFSQKYFKFTSTLKINKCEHIKWKQSISTNLNFVFELWNLISFTYFHGSIILRVFLSFLDINKHWFTS